MTSTPVQTPRTDFLCGDDTPLSHMCALVLELAPPGSAQADAAAGCNAHWSSMREGMAQLEIKLSESRRLVEEDKRDAERYRWLRDYARANNQDSLFIGCRHANGVSQFCVDVADAAIDSAIKGK